MADGSGSDLSCIPEQLPVQVGLNPLQHDPLLVLGQAQLILEMLSHSSCNIVYSLGLLVRPVLKMGGAVREEVVLTLGIQLEVPKTKRRLEAL